MSVRDAAARRPTHPEPVTATRPRRDGSPYRPPHAGFSLLDEPGMRRRLRLEVAPR